MWGKKPNIFLRSSFLFKIIKPDLSFLKCMHYGGMLDTTIKFTRLFLAQTLTPNSDKTLRILELEYANIMQSCEVQVFGDATLYQGASASRCFERS